MANDLKKWKERRNIASKKFDQDAKQNIIKWRNYYRGNQWPNQWNSDDKERPAGYTDTTVDNMVFANIRAIMPSINFNNPKVFVDAKRKPFIDKKGMLFDTNAAAILFENLLNYYVQELQMKREVDKCLLDALIGPWGIMQVGFTAETEKIKGDEVLEVNELIKGNSPFATRISPLDFIQDSEAKDSHLNDAGFCGVKWIKTLDEVKKNPKYENTTDLKPNATVKTEFTNGNVVGPSSATLSKDSDSARVEGWDIWSIKDQRLITIVDSHPKFLRNEKDWPIEFDGYPFETLYFNENPDQIYPVSDVDIYLSAQDELNRFRSLQLSHAKRVSQRKYIVRENAFESAELDKIQYGPDGSIATTTGDPNTAIIPLKDAGTSQDIYLAINQLKTAIGEGSGVAKFEQGIAQKFDTATEPALIAQATSIKRAERLAIMEDFYIRINKKIGKILQQTMESESIPLNEKQFLAAQKSTPTKLAKIIGSEEQTVLLPWLEMDRDDIQGDFDFTLDIGSTAPINQEKRKQDIATVAQMLAGNPLIKLDESTRRILEAFEVKDIEALLKSPEELQAEQQQQQAAQEAAVQAEIQKDMPKRQVDLAKTEAKNKTALEKESMGNETAINTALINALANKSREERKGEKE